MSLSRALRRDSSLIFAADKTFIELLRTRLELLGEKSPQFISSLTNTGDASRVISSAVRVALDLLKAIETEMISNDGN